METPHHDAVADQSLMPKPGRTLRPRSPRADDHAHSKKTTQGAATPVKKRVSQGGGRKLPLSLVLLNLLVAPPPLSIRGMAGLFSDVHFSPALFSSTHMPL